MTSTPRNVNRNLMKREMSRIDPCTRISISISKCPLFFSPTSTSLLYLGIQTINGTKCPPNAAPQVTIFSCIYPKIKKKTLTFTLTSLLEIGSKGLHLKGHFNLINKIGHFRVSVCLLFKASLSAKFFLRNLVFINI